MPKMHHAFAARAALDLSAADSVSHAQREQLESSSHTLSSLIRKAHKKTRRKLGHLTALSATYTKCTEKNSCNDMYVLLICLVNMVFYMSTTAVITNDNRLGQSAPSTLLQLHQSAYVYVGSLSHTGRVIYCPHISKKQVLKGI